MASVSMFELETGHVRAESVFSGIDGEDRRKREFRSLVSDIAEHLDDNNVKSIIWQEQLPSSLTGKTSLDVLQYLYKHGKFSESKVAPLVQLLKDIHREDLTSKVDTFLEKYGRHYSMPDSMQSARQNLVKQRANTVSDIQPVTGSGMHTIPTISINPTETSQELIATPTQAQKSNSENYAVTMSSSAPIQSLLSAQFQQSCDPISESPPTCQQPQQWDLDDVTLVAQGLHHFPRITRLANEGSLRYSHSSLHQNENRKISAPTTHTRDSLSGSSGFLGLPPITHSPQVPHGNLHWYMSNPSSPEVSQEYIAPDPADSNVAGQNRVPSLYQLGTFKQHRQHSQTSLKSLPTRMPDIDNYSLSPSDSHFIMPANPPPSVKMLPQTHVAVGRPIGRSLSLVHHRKRAHTGVHRRYHTINSPRVNGRKVLASPCNLPHSNWSQSPSGHYIHSFSPVNYSHCPQCGQTPVPPFIHNGDAFLPTISQDVCCAERGWEDLEHPTSSRNQLPVNTEESLRHDPKHYQNSQSYLPDCHDDVFDGELEQEPSPYTAYTGEETSNEHHLSKQNPPAAAHNNGVKNKVQNNNYLMADHQNARDMQTLSTRTGTDIRPSSASCGPSAITTSSHTLHSHSFARSLPSLSVKKTLAPAATGATDPSSVASGVDSAKQRRRYNLFPISTKSKTKHLLQNEVIWAIKRDRLNKCIYKHTSKMLTCKTKLELLPKFDKDSHPLPKLTLELHPYGSEEDANTAVTAKVTIEFPKKCRLHSERRINFCIQAREDDGHSGSLIGPLQTRQEKITQNFFYVKGFIVHEDLKNSQCDYVQVIAKVELM